MKLSEFSVKRPVAMSMLYLAIVVLSIVSLSKLAVDILPEITFPAITITTKYQGAGPEDIEKQVTQIIESFVGIVPNLKEIQSKSVENFSIVRLLFNWGTNLDEATNDVRSRLDFAKRFLPKEAESPNILKFDLSQAPIMFLTASAQQNFGRLSNILTDEVAEPLKRIPGIGNVFVIGGVERQIRVDVDKHRLAAYNISLSQVTQSLAAHNISMPAGDLEIGGQAFFLRLPSEFRDTTEISKTLIGSFQGRPIFLGDIASVKDDFAEPIMITRQNDEKSAIIIVQKRSGANTLTVANAVEKKLTEIKHKLPPDVKLMIAFNMADSVKRSIESLTNSVFIGGLLVIIVTYLFLFNLRSSLVILITIPISLIVAFLFLYLMGYTINIMSLSSIAIAIGMVVDNAIVVLENIIRRHNELNEPTTEAAINGASEVGLAVSASTLTTVVVFLPLIFSQGLVGILFKQLGAVISITLLVSLAISLTLSPMIASLLIKPLDKKKRTVIQQKLENLIKSAINRANVFFHNILVYSLSNRKKIIVIALAIFIVSLSLLRFIGTEFFPEQDAGFLQVYIKMPVNTPLADSDKFAQTVISEASKILGKDSEVIFTKTGMSPFGGGGFEEEGPNIIEFSARLVDKQKRKRGIKELAMLLRHRIQQIPGPWKVDFMTGDPMSERLGGAGKPISVEILGYDINTTDIVAEKVKEILHKIPGIVDVSISRERGKLEYQLKIDRPKLATLGIPPAVVADTLNIAFAGRTATRFREGKDEYNVFVRLRPQDRKDIKDVLGLPVKTPDGRSFLVGDLVKAEIAQGPLAIERKDQQRYITVDANIYRRTLGEVARDIEKEIKKIAFPSGVYVELTGSVKEQREAFRDLLFAFLLAALLTYMVMAAQFESFRDPFIIMFSVPFAIVGVLWGLFLTGQTFNVASFIGLVMLVGIVVNNAIVFIDYTIRLRAKNMPVKEALMESARVRLRPILMTTITTIFGMLPLALSRGQGSEVWRPLAVAVIGGLSFSTLITLVIVPVLYSIFEERIKRF